MPFITCARFPCTCGEEDVPPARTPAGAAPRGADGVPREGVWPGTSPTPMLAANAQPTDILIHEGIFIFRAPPGKSISEIQAGIQHEPAIAGRSGDPAEGHIVSNRSDSGTSADAVNVDIRSAEIR